MTTTADSIRELRSQLVANGFRPVPVRTGDKRPVGFGWADRARRGEPIPATDPGAANTGLLGDGLRILDVDLDHPEKAAEIERLAFELLGRGPTRIRDNSARRAIIYRAESGAPPKRKIEGEFGKLEILGAGQQLLAFGKHPSGAEFAWRNGSPADTPIHELPAVSEDAVSEFLKEAKAIIGAESSAAPEPPRHREPAAAPIAREGDRVRNWALATLEGIARDLAAIGKGGRNDALNRAAHRLGTIASNGWLSETEIQLALEDACQSNGLVSEDGIAAVRKTIASGLRAGLAAEPHPGPEDRPRDEPDLGSVRAFVEGQAAGAEQTKAAQPAPSPLAFRWHGEDSTLEPRRELIKSLLPAVGVCLLSGQSGSGKTFLALDMAASIALGQDWFGKRVREPGGSLILAAEGGGTIAERLEAIRVGKHRAVDRMPIGWLELAEPLNAKGALPRIAEAIEIAKARIASEHRASLKAIFLDTLAAGFQIEDENDAGQATRAMQALQAIAARFECLVIGIGHHGKQIEAGHRGSSAWQASADAVLSVLAERDSLIGEVSHRQLALTKSRWRETGWAEQFELKPVEIGIDEDGEPITSAIVSPLAGAGRIVSAGKPSANRPSLGKDIFAAAFQAMISDHGKEVRPFGAKSIPVIAVPLRLVREEFARRYPNEDGDAEQQSARTRKAFSRAMTATSRTHQHREIDGESLVWRTLGATDNG